MRCFLVMTFALFSDVSGVTLRHGLDALAGKDLAAKIDFADVVQVAVGSTGGGGISGSGVLLNDGWVLTAAHVVNSAAAGEVTVQSGGAEYCVTSVHANPGWLAHPATGLAQRSDLVLLRLSDPAPSAPVVPLWQGGGSDPLIGLMAGFGNGGNGLLGAYLPADGLQAGFNFVDRHLLADGGAFWVTDFDSGQSRHNSLNLATVDLRHFDLGKGNPKLSETVFTVAENASQAGFGGLPTGASFFPELGEVFMEGTTARGDSGGPLFLYSQDRSRWELAGVTSFGVNPLFPAGFNRFDSRYGDLSFFSDVSNQKEWLDSVMIPEPSQAILLAMSLTMVWKRRRFPSPFLRARNT